MKRKLACLAIVAVACTMATFAAPHPAHAEIIRWETVTFKGVVTRPNGTPVPNVMVVVDCLDGPSGFTDSSGHYVIQGSAHLCLGDDIAVSTFIQFSPNLSPSDKATLLDGSAHTTTSPHHDNQANIRMGIHTIQVPEFGWAEGLAAGGGGIGVIAYTRAIKRSRR